MNIRKFIKILKYINKSREIKHEFPQRLKRHVTNSPSILAKISKYELIDTLNMFDIIPVSCFMGPPEEFTIII